LLADRRLPQKTSLQDKELGVNVMILNIFLQKNYSRKMCFLIQSTRFYAKEMNPGKIAKNIIFMASTGLCAIFRLSDFVEQTFVSRANSVEQT
jgi:hypothetical protein